MQSRQSSVCFQRLDHERLNLDAHLFKLIDILNVEATSLSAQRSNFKSHHASLASQVVLPYILPNNYVQTLPLSHVVQDWLVSKLEEPWQYHFTNLILDCSTVSASLSQPAVEPEVSQMDSSTIDSHQIFRIQRLGLVPFYLAGAFLSVLAFFRFSCHRILIDSE